MQAYCIYGYLIRIWSCHDPSNLDKSRSMSCSIILLLYNQSQFCFPGRGIHKSATCFKWNIFQTKNRACNSQIFVKLHPTNLLLSFFIKCLLQIQITSFVGELGQFSMHVYLFIDHKVIYWIAIILLKISAGCNILPVFACFKYIHFGNQKLLAFWKMILRQLLSWFCLSEWSWLCCFVTEIIFLWGPKPCSSYLTNPIDTCFNIYNICWYAV